ncbi:alpha/beta fold hydrolase [Gracilibacillus salinarum]|uniref:Alpha/beta hydrolase n=1 Tax=Gracilibacillus salinarum TaxID=2932255 RepID=A0ABY4GKM7_9BACI|nr:hypothetical protein [Gracilibacillus salinarum]UOQ84753.1 hypothetical protein MUN87_19185 [Gracilibacillus salinarum]
MCFATLYPDHVAKIVLLDQGHKKMPLFPKEYGLFRFAIPLVSVFESVFGNAFVKIIEKPFLAVESEVEKEQSMEKFCDRFYLEESDYIRKAFREEVPVNREGIRLLFGYYRLHLPKLLHRITAPCLLIYASFKDKNMKEEQVTAKEIEHLQPNQNIELFKMDTQHYMHWEDEECLVKIKAFLLD